MNNRNKDLLKLLKASRPLFSVISAKSIMRHKWTSEGYAYYEERRYFDVLKFTLLAGYLAFILLMAMAMQGFVCPRIMISFSIALKNAFKVE